MYSYIKGLLVEQGSNYIVIENNGIGYKIFVANPYVFNAQKANMVYLYSHIREDEYSLYGFVTIEERELFLKLINVKGLGPKMALPILATGSLSGIQDAIERENILYLEKFPKIGEKLARQIILDLKGKLAKSPIKGNDDTSELVAVLESLGYKMADIKRVLPSLDQTHSIEQNVKEALKLLLK